MSAEPDAETRVSEPERKHKVKLPPGLVYPERPEPRRKDRHKDLD